MTKISLVVAGSLAFVAVAAGLDMMADDRNGAWRLFVFAAAMVSLIFAQWFQHRKPGEFSLQARQSFPQSVALTASRGGNLALGLASLCLLLAFVDFTRLGDAPPGYVVFCALLSILLGIPGGLLIAASLRPSCLLLGQRTFATEECSCRGGALSE